MGARIIALHIILALGIRRDAASIRGLLAVATGDISVTAGQTGQVFSIAVDASVAKAVRC